MLLCEHVQKVIDRISVKIKHQSCKTALYLLLMQELGINGMLRYFSIFLHQNINVVNSAESSLSDASKE